MMAAAQPAVGTIILHFYKNVNKSCVKLTEIFFDFILFAGFLHKTALK